MTADQIVKQAWGENSGTTSTLFGVSASPRNLQGGEIYNALCPWQCLQYTVGGDFPVVSIHQPFPVKASVMLDSLVEALYASPYSRPKLVEEGAPRSGVAPDGSKLLIQEFSNRESRAGAQYVIVAIEREGMTALVDMQYSGERDMRMIEAVLQPVLDTLKFDAASIARQSKARQQALTAAPEAVRKGFAAGGKAQIYTRMTLELDTVSTFGGLTGVRHTMILLPGGVAVRTLPTQAFGTIDYPALLGTDTPGQWKRQGNTLSIDWGNSLETFTASGGKLVSNLDSDTQKFPWNLAATLKPPDLAGTYTYSYISGAGSTFTPGGSATSAGDGRLTLASDGTYRLSGARFGGFSGGNVTAGSSSKSVEEGRWAFDPASYTVTFTPTGGKVYRVPAFKRGENECTPSAGCVWVIAGQEWERK